MDFFQILTDIEKVDPEVYARFDTRRRVFKHMSGLGKKITVATLPALLGTVFTKAYGQTTALPQIIIDTLNLALSLEYLEYYYYSQGVSSGLFTGNDLNAITIIRDDEQRHINALRTVLGNSAIADPTAASYDYAAGGNLTPFANAAMFLAVLQGFVDTGVRAYKGGAAGGPLTSAAYGAGTNATTYPAEDNVTQGGVNVQTNATAPTGLTITQAAATEAFDEPLDATAVKAIARNFISTLGVSKGLFS